VSFLEVGLTPTPVDVRTDGYEIAWPSGMRLRVPRGFCPEEMAMLLELLKEGEGE
jgi:KaiC/GvpD/RAD55 family RecA-like ATPase